MSRLSFSVFGHFRVVDAQGRDRTPTGEKAQALLAMLVTASGCKRTRSWVQDKLWSESNTEQGRASLRQALTKIRKAFGPDAEVLGSNRHAIWLDPDQIDSDWTGAADAGSGAEFLEGIDIADSEFDHWLQSIRTGGTGLPVRADRSRADMDVPAAVRSHCVFLAVSQARETHAALLETAFAHLIARNITEQTDFTVSFDSPPQDHSHGLTVDINALPAGQGAFALSVTAKDTPHRRILWHEVISVDRVVADMQTNMDLLGLAFRLQTAVIGLAAGPGVQRAADGGRIGAIMRQVFSFQDADVLLADSALRSTDQDATAAVAMGWRSQIAVIRLIERFANCEQTTIEEGLDCANRAVEAAPMNSMVLASASNAHAFLADNEISAAELAQLAVQLNPSNPFAWWAYSNAALYNEDYVKAQSAAQLGARLSAKSALHFWCEFQLGLASLMRGDLDKAVRCLETSAALSPRFRPPRRYLLAIHASRGNKARAQRLVRELEKLEAGFTVDELFRNEAYPVSLARRAGLIRPDMVTQLI